MDQHDLSVEFRPSRSSSALSFSSQSSVSTPASTIGTSFQSGPLTRPGLTCTSQSKPPPSSLLYQTQKGPSTTSHLSTMTDQRRHTVDFSNWTAMGLTYEHFAPMQQSQLQQQQQQQQKQQQQQQQQLLSSNAGFRESQDQVQSPYYGSSPSTSDRHSSGFVPANFQHRGSSSISASPSGPGGEDKSVRTHFHLPPQHPSLSRLGNSNLHPAGNTLSDSLGRRASMSHLPLCSVGGGGGGDGHDSWDLVRRIVHPFCFSPISSFLFDALLLEASLFCFFFLIMLPTP